MNSLKTVADKIRAIEEDAGRSIAERIIDLEALRRTWAAQTEDVREVGSRLKPVYSGGGVSFSRTPPVGSKKVPNPQAIEAVRLIDQAHARLGALDAPAGSAPSATNAPTFVLRGIADLLAAGIFERVGNGLYKHGPAGSNQLIFYYVAKAYPNFPVAVLAKFFRNHNGSIFNEANSRARIGEFKRGKKSPKGAERIDLALANKN